MRFSSCCWKLWCLYGIIFSLLSFLSFREFLCTDHLTTRTSKIQELVQLYINNFIGWSKRTSKNDAVHRVSEMKDLWRISFMKYTNPVRMWSYWRLMPKSQAIGVESSKFVLLTSLKCVFSWKEYEDNFYASLAIRKEKYWRSVFSSEKEMMRLVWDECEDMISTDWKIISIIKEMADVKVLLKVLAEDTGIQTLRIGNFESNRCSFSDRAWCWWDHCFESR